MPRLPQSDKENAVKWSFRVPISTVARWYGVHVSTVRYWLKTIEIDTTRPELPDRRLQTKQVECVRGEDGVTWRRT